jgi:hypothetical protein
MTAQAVASIRFMTDVSWDWTTTGRWREDGERGGLDVLQHGVGVGIRPPASSGERSRNDADAKEHERRNDIDLNDQRMGRAQKPGRAAVSRMAASVSRTRRSAPTIVSRCRPPSAISRNQMDAK